MAGRLVPGPGDGSARPDSDDPWIRHHHELIRLGGGAVVLGTMYDKLIEAVRHLPRATVVQSVAGAAEDTYELLAYALGSQEPIGG